MTDNKSGEILIIEDDKDINDLLATALSKAGYRTRQAWSGTEGELLLKLDMEAYALVLLDLMLPGLSGEELLARIRQMDASLPVIILTAKDELDEKIKNETGQGDTANTYIAGPVKIEHRQLVLDRISRQLYVADNAVYGITKQEFAILELLMAHPRQVFAKEDIFEYAWDEPYMGETKTLDVHISNIRKKIKKLTDDEYIETVWGIGYKMKE